VTTDAVTLLLALLTVASWLASAILIAAHLSSRLRPTVAGLLAGQVLPLALLVAAVSMAGSLYLSEVADFPPCVLCWYQRIAMYPQVLLLGIAWFRRDEGIRHYSLPLAVIGAAISTYHVVLERYPWLEDTGVCDPTNPCTIRWVERFGFITIPTMALSAFVLLALLMTHLPSAAPDEPAPVPDDDLSRTEAP
jgi:disulfide bond formation protein DsbB